MSRRPSGTGPTTESTRRQPKPSVSTYCALEKGTNEVSSHFEHRGAAMQEVRFVIEDIAPDWKKGTITASWITTMTQGPLSPIFKRSFGC